MKWNRGVSALALALCLSLTACGQSGPGQPRPELPPPEPAEERPLTYFTVNQGGIEFYIPSYYEKNQERSTQETLWFDARLGGELCFRLTLSQQSLDVDLSQEDFLAHKEEFFKAARGEGSSDYHVLLTEEGSLAGLPCETVICTPADPFADIRVIVNSYTFNAAEGTAVWAWFGAFSADHASARADYRKMLTTATVMPAQQEPDPPQRLLRALPKNPDSKGSSCYPIHFSRRDDATGENIS